MTLASNILRDLQDILEISISLAIDARIELLI